MLDTGATITTFDTTALCLKGYPVVNILETSLIETANGIIKVGIFKTDSITFLGRTVCNMHVQVYDFLAHGILSDYDGVLGLDFFKNTKFCIDMINQTVEIKCIKS